MNSFDVIANLIQKKSLNSSDLGYILTMDKEEIIQNLIGVKGGFVFRAYMLERLLELLNGPKGIAVPQHIYTSAILDAKQRVRELAE